MTSQIVALEELVSGVHDPSLSVKVDSPPAALPKWDVHLLPMDLGGASPPTPSTSNCEVAAQPSTLPLKRPYDEDCNHCSLAPLEDLDDNLDLDDSKDPSEAKRQKRMRRNRESAAMSRERKKAYIEQLESKLSELSAMASTLRSENDALRNGRAPLEGSAPVPVPSSALVPAPTELEESLLLMPCLQTSDNDSESNDGTDSHTMEGYSLDVFSQEPPSSLTLPAEPAALFDSAIESFDS
jgi:hypothetical protein